MQARNPTALAHQRRQAIHHNVSDDLNSPRCRDRILKLQLDVNLTAILAQSSREALARVEDFLEPVWNKGDIGEEALLRLINQANEDRAIAEGAETSAPAASSSSSSGSASATQNQPPAPATASLPLTRVGPLEKT